MIHVRIIFVVILHQIILDRLENAFNVHLHLLRWSNDLEILRQLAIAWPLLNFCGHTL